MDIGELQQDKAQKREKLELLGQRYRQYLETAQKATTTIEGYRELLKYFFDYLEEMNITDIQQVTKSVLLDYQKHIFYLTMPRGNKRQPGTQNNYLRAVKGFFDFLYQESYLSYDPARDMKYAKEPETLPKVILTPQEMKKIIQQPDTSTVLGYRDRTILEVLYSTGIRRNELRNLEVSEVDYKEGYIRITQGKGGKDRVVPLGRLACKYVENYIKGIRPELAKDTNLKYLFISLHRNRLDKNRLRYLILKYAKLAGLEKHVTCHTFRHSCATHMIRNRANIRYVQELLGHKDIKNTQKYIQLTITDLKEAHKRYHPREREKDE